MAEYKHTKFLSQASDEIYDRSTFAGLDAPVAGIYRCTVCGREVCVSEREKLPPQNHHMHKVGFVQIYWQLVVAPHSGVQ